MYLYNVKEVSVMEIQLFGWRGKRSQFSKSGEMFLFGSILLEDLAFI